MFFNHALVICLSDAWGGLEQVAAEDAVSLQKNKRILLAVHALGYANSPFMQFCRTHLKPNSVIARARLAHPFLDFSLAFDIVRWGLRERNGKLSLFVHQTSLLKGVRLGQVVLRFLFGVRCRLVVFRHIHTVQAKRSIFHRWLYRTVDAFICLSPGALKQTQPLFPENLKNKMRFIPLKVESPALSPNDYFKPRENDSSFIWLHVGRIDPKKHQLKTVEAYAQWKKQWKKKYPELKTELWLVGGPSPSAESHAYEKTLHENVHALEESGRVRAGEIRLFGFQTDLETYYRQAHAFILPSEDEAFGRVFIEAQFRGLPVIVGKGPSSLDIIQNGDLGIEVDGSDVAVLTEAMHALKTDYSKFQSRLKAAYADLRYTYSEENRLNQLLALL